LHTSAYHIEAHGDERQAEVFYARRTKNERRLPYNHSPTYRSANRQLLPNRAAFPAWKRMNMLFLSK